MSSHLIEDQADETVSYIENGSQNALYKVSKYG